MCRSPTVALTPGALSRHSSIHFLTHTIAYLGSDDQRRHCNLPRVARSGQAQGRPHPAATQHYTLPPLTLSPPTMTSSSRRTPQGCPTSM
eukprot:15617228-Heterocapsa_arctica.AAC.1